MNCDVSINYQSDLSSSPTLSTSPDSRSYMTANVGINADYYNEYSCSGEDKGNFVMFLYCLTIKIYYCYQN